MISEKVIESITPRILKLVDDSIKPHLEKVKQCQEAITHKEIEINKQNKVCNEHFVWITFQFFLVPEDELSLSVC
jgi:hypothetical protein